MTLSVHTIDPHCQSFVTARFDSVELYSRDQATYLHELQAETGVHTQPWTGINLFHGIAVRITDVHTPQHRGAYDY
jgi:hypothetical protein